MLSNAKRVMLPWCDLPRQVVLVAAVKVQDRIGDPVTLRFQFEMRYYVAFVDKIIEYFVMHRAGVERENSIHLRKKINIEHEADRIARQIGSSSWALTHIYKLVFHKTYT
ncbi:hypothetical protein E0H72_15690 [Rhizobium leguminosarum bv. viciae]|uniref:hypothetical protein n=1 Tax=Rhizobium leguminosarum TaxID=384 RepID=UPI00103ED8AE|nr:hypothetical protein [Rhizobium leguminosarum]TCA42872.1 hypothetical protein E0H72_15690 [Rhizobium leguminosarum bv. viciae]